MKPRKPYRIVTTYRGKIEEARQAGYDEGVRDVMRACARMIAAGARVAAVRDRKPKS